MPNTKSKQRIYLTEDEKSVLGKLLGEWSTKKGKKEQNAFVSAEAIPKIQQLNLTQFGPEIISQDKAAKMLWERRIEAVYTWFSNNKPFKDRAVFKLERRTQLRHVVGKLRADDINAIIAANNPDVKKGDKNYPGLFQSAVSQYIKELSDEKREEMEKVRDEWQASGPPLDVQLRAATKYSRRGIINAHQLLQKEMYVSCITFSFYPEPDTGVMAVVCHDYIADLHAKIHGKKFKTFKEWNKDGYSRLVTEMIGYANYVDAERKSEEGRPVETPAPVNFERGPGGLPVLPPALKGARGGELAKQAQEILRAYFLRHYQLATGCETARTPWATIGEDPSKFFDVASLPGGFRFQDPSRMGLTVKDLLKHLRIRQDSLGVNAFHFHHVLRNNKLEAAEYPEEAQKIITGETEIAVGNTADRCIKTDPPLLQTNQKASDSRRRMDTDPVQDMDVDAKLDQLGISFPSAQTSSPSPWTFDNVSYPSYHHPMQGPPSMPVPMFQPHFPTPWGQIPGSGSLPTPATATAAAVLNPAPHADQKYLPVQPYPFSFNQQQYMQYWAQLPQENKPDLGLSSTDQSLSRPEPMFGALDPHMLPPGAPVFPPPWPPQLPGSQFGNTDHMLPSGHPVFAHMPDTSTTTHPPWPPQVPVAASGVPIPVTTPTSSRRSPIKRGQTNQSSTKKTPRRSTRTNGTASATPTPSTRTRKPTQKI